MSADGLTATARAGMRLSDLHLYAGLFSAAVGAFCLAQVIGHRLGLAADLVAIAGDATCGWSWLLVRALFQPPTARRAGWPLVLVLTLVATGAFLRLYDGGAAPIPRMVENLALLVSSTLLLLAALEPLTSLDRGMARAERVFRIGFAAGYVTVLAIAVIWVNGAPAGSGAERFGPAIKGACAVIALLGMGFAVWYRGRHPLPASPAATGRSRRPPQAEDTGGLAERLLRLMTIEAIYTRPSLKVADLARAVAEAEYKVSRCITGPLGFRNFNHMANHFRIEEAKQRLSDPARDHLPILTVAYDCGFGSIGPFNRTFKAQTGVTPQQFRQARQAGKPAAGQPPGAAGPALDI